MEPPRSGTAPAAASGAKKVVTVGVGDMRASRDPQTVFVSHSLGSCIGVAVYDPQTHIGGVLHAMLPSSPTSGGSTSRPHMFVDTGLPSLINAVCTLGAVKERLQIRIAGGAQFIGKSQIFNIGSQNTASAQELLLTNGLSAQLVECGGQYSRTLRLDLSNGGLTIEAPGCQSRQL